MAREKFESKGVARFYFDGNNVVTAFASYPSIFPVPNGEPPISVRHEVYDLIPGDQFARDVEAGAIISYDGSIANVFVDGHDSNLGLHTEDFSDGGFLVDIGSFKKLCEAHEIVVNWANR